MQRGDHIKLNFEILEMQKWNIPTDKTQRVDEKNGVICFTRRVIVIRMSKMAPFFVFSADDGKKSVTVWAKYLSTLYIWKILLNSFRKCYGLLDSQLPLARCQPLKIKGLGIFFADSVVVFYISNLNISHER